VAGFGSGAEGQQKGAARSGPGAGGFTSPVRDESCCGEATAQTGLTDEPGDGGLCDCQGGQGGGETLLDELKAPLG